MGGCGASFEISQGLSLSLSCSPFCVEVVVAVVGGGGGGGVGFLAFGGLPFGFPRPRAGETVSSILFCDSFSGFLVFIVDCEGPRRV